MATLVLGAAGAALGGRHRRLDSRCLHRHHRRQASIRGVGCDCLGLAQDVWRDVVGPEPLPIPPYQPGLGRDGLE